MLKALLDRLLEFDTLSGGQDLADCQGIFKTGIGNLPLKRLHIVAIDSTSGPSTVIRNQNISSTWWWLINLTVARQQRFTSQGIVASREWAVDGGFTILNLGRTAPA